MHDEGVTYFFPYYSKGGGGGSGGFFAILQKEVFIVLFTHDNSLACFFFTLDEIEFWSQ